jgi:demethylmenaquinone methyltransferase/2-methoxy-6-polyprenyl-1,4-benzoquinol methylase
VPPQQVLATLRAAGLTQVRQHLAVSVFSEYQAVKAGPVPTT